MALITLRVPGNRRPSSGRRRQPVEDAAGAAAVAAQSRFGCSQRHVTRPPASRRHPPNRRRCRRRGRRWNPTLETAGEIPEKHEEDRTPFPPSISLRHLLLGRFFVSVCVVGVWVCVCVCSGRSPRVVVPSSRAERNVKKKTSPSGESSKKKTNEKRIDQVSARLQVVYLVFT